MSSALSARGLTKRYSGLVAVDDVSLEVAAGEVLGVIGPNGAGKSTLIGMLSGSIKPTAGRVVLGATEITGRRPHVACRHGLARTHQIPRPFAELTVAENVSIAAHFGGHGGRVEPVLERCQLADERDVPAAELTHGGQRRLELARALATRPDVLLLDEVGAGLGERELAGLEALIRSIRDDGLAVVMVEHIMPLVMALCDRVTVIETGAQIATGSPREVAEDPAVIEAYLGVA